MSHAAPWAHDCRSESLRERSDEAIQTPSFRGDAKHRTRNLEIPGLRLTAHPGMTESIEMVITGLDPVIHLLRKNFLRRLMDARIKSGHDGCVLWPTPFSETVVASQRVAMTKYPDMRSPSRREAPEALMNLPPLGGRGERRMPNAPAVSCAMIVVERTRVTTSTPESPGIPARNGFNGFLRALPGDRALLPPSSADMSCLSPVGPT